MVMRLLPKSEVLEKRAAEQQRKVEEGLQIAKRIDRLRETLLEEEASLEKFRRESIATIHREIEAANAELAPLRTEMHTLRAERIELMKPLDAEWAYAALVRNELQIERLSVDLRIEEAEKKEKAASLLNTNATRLMYDAERTNEVANAALVEAENARIDAQNKRSDARKSLEDTTKWKEEVEKDLIHRNAEVGMREAGVTMKEARLKERESALSQEWKLLDDRKKMLERDIIRAKK